MNLPIKDINEGDVLSQENMGQETGTGEIKAEFYKDVLGKIAERCKRYTHKLEGF